MKPTGPKNPAAVTGVILAGGKSTRYGENKALVKVGGTSLIEQVVRVMQSQFSRVLLVTNSPREYSHLNLPMHRDLIPGLGPLSGIHTGLSLISGEAAFFAACDMPALNPDLIGYMLSVREDFDVVIPRIGKNVEPLHAIYHRRCLPAIERLIKARGHRIIQFFGEVSVRYVDEDEIRRVDPGCWSFFNINRPEELEALKKGSRGA